MRYEYEYAVNDNEKRTISVVAESEHRSLLKVKEKIADFEFTEEENITYLAYLGMKPDQQIVECESCSS